MQLEPSPLERFFTARPGPVVRSLASTAVTAWLPAELAAWLPTDWASDIDWGYATPEGDGILRGLIATSLNLAGAEHVLLTAGAVEANFLALMSLLGPGDEAIVQLPIYPQLPCVAAATGARVVALGLDVTPARVAALMTPATRLVVLNSPHNPTGQIVDAETIQAIAGLVRAHPRAHLLVDEVYRGAGEAEPPVATLALTGSTRVLTTDSTSKRWALPGARVGWLAGDRQAVAAAIIWREHTSLALASPATTVVKALWPKREALFAANRAVVARNRQIVSDWLMANPRFSGDPSPHAACFLLAGPFADDVALATHWYDQAQTLVIPGATLGFPGMLRVGYGHRNPDALVEALAFVAQAL